MGTSQKRLAGRPGRRGIVQGTSGSADASPSFFRLLPSVFVYPFIGRGKFILIGGAVALAAVGYLGVMGMVLGFLLAGYLAMYLMEVIGSCAGGNDEPPGWPDLREVDDTVRPLLLLVGTVVISLGPALIYRFGPGVLDLLIPSLIMGKGWWEPVSRVFWVLLVAGALYAPMGLLSVVMHQSLAAIGPHKVLVAIVRVAPYYIVALAIMALACVASIIVASYVSFVPLVGHAVTVYLLLAEGRVLGLIYRTQASRLRWFE